MTDTNERNDKQTDFSRIRFRQDYFDKWQTINPIPLQGEPCYVIDRSILIVGDGIHTFNELLETNSFITEDFLETKLTPIKENILDVENDIQRLNFDLNTKANKDMDNLSVAGNAYVGVKGYFSNRTYQENDVVQVFDGNDTKMYRSLIDNNIGNPVTDTTKWAVAIRIEDASLPTTEYNVINHGATLSGNEAIINRDGYVEIPTSVYDKLYQLQDRKHDWRITLKITVNELINNTIVFGTTNNMLHGEVKQNGDNYRLVVYKKTSYSSQDQVGYRFENLTAGSPIYLRILYEGDANALLSSYSLDNITWTTPDLGDDLSGLTLSSNEAFFFGKNSDSAINFNGTFHLDYCFFEENTVDNFGNRGEYITFFKCMGDTIPGKKGIVALYNGKGQNEDGSVTQKLFTDTVNELANKDLSNLTPTGENHFVNLTSNQSISGVKAFNGRVRVENNNDDTDIVMKNTGVASNNEIPEVNQARAFRYTANNGDIIGDVRFILFTDGKTQSELIARRTINGVQKTCTLKTIVNQDGSTQASAPNPPSASNDTSIATTYWVRSNAGGGIPVGTILPYGGTTAPAGFLLCNGGAISRTTYANLFSVIGTAYGAGDGNTTFNLPNGTGRYIGYNGTGNLSANLPNITGTIEYHVYASNATGAFYNNGGVKRKGNGDDSGSTGGNKAFSASRSSSIYTSTNEVRPLTLRTNLIIKF